MNGIYPKWKEAVMVHAAGSSLAGNVRAALVDTGAYTYNASHEFLSSVTGIVATGPVLTGKTTTNGTFNADDFAFANVTGVTAEAIIYYIDTGSVATSRLIYYVDTGGSGLPFTPNGGDGNVIHDPAGVFRLGA